MDGCVTILMSWVVIVLYVRALGYKMGYFNKWGRKVLYGRKQ